MDRYPKTPADKLVRVTTETHARIWEFCAARDLKFGATLERALREGMDAIERRYRPIDETR